MGVELRACVRPAPRPPSVAWGWVTICGGERMRGGLRVLVRSVAGPWGRTAVPVAWGLEVRVMEKYCQP